MGNRMVNQYPGNKVIIAHVEKILNEFLNKEFPNISKDWKVILRPNKELDKYKPENLKFFGIDLGHSHVLE